MTPRQQPPPALTPRQERVVKRLREQISEGTAEWFTAACELLSQEPHPRALTHLVGHLYREIEGAVRFVLDPVKEKRGHAASVQAVLDDLGMSAEEEPAVFWLELASGDRGLAMRAHRSALERPRPADGEFAELVDSFEGLLDRLLKRFEDRYANVFTRLDELLKVQQPGRGHAGQLRDGFPQNHVTLRYFFERAAPEWLVPLRDAGFFSSPPEPVPHDDTGTLDVPPWPQALYLLRVASDRPGEVLETAVAIPATGNGLVNANLAELALRFPAGEAARLVPRVIASLDAPFGVLDPVGVGRLCRHLAAGGRPADALVLTEALLTRLPGSRGSRAVMDTWSFAEVLRTSVPAVARACGLPAVSLLARVLDETVAAQTPASLREARRDNSGWWRPSIEGQPPGTDTDPASALVSALRDACAEALSAGAGLAAVIAEIESHDWPVFRRLALFLLSEHAGDGDAALVGARLSDAAVIQDPGLDREFFLLARRRCAAVGGRDRERLLALIDRGPQSPQQQLRRERNGTPPSAAETRARVCRWQRDRLAAIEPVLPPERLAHYRDLVAEFGAAPEQPATLPAIRDIAVGSPVAARRPRGVLNRGPGKAPGHLGAARRPAGSRPARSGLRPLFRHPAGRGRPVIGSRGVHRPSGRVRRGPHQRLLAGGAGGHGTGLAGGPEPVLMGGPAGRGGTARPRRPLVEAVGGGPHGVACGCWKPASPPPAMRFPPSSAARPGRSSRTRPQTPTPRPRRRPVRRDRRWARSPWPMSGPRR